MNNASGRTAAQVGLIDGYNTTSGNFGDNLYHNYNDVEAGRLRANADSGNYFKYHVMQQLEDLNLEPNTQYTFSVYAKTNRNPPSTNSYFNFWCYNYSCTITSIIYFFNLFIFFRGQSSI